MAKNPISTLRNRLDPPICLLHVGKTGGTYVKDLLNANMSRTQRRIVLLAHGDTAASSAVEHGPRRELAFVFRAPEARFISGFYSRQRQGRPVHPRIWTPAEATVFSMFGTPNALAEALMSKDDGTLSAAHFAMKHINHLRNGYARCFGSVAAFDAMVPSIRACIDLDDLDDNLPWFLARLGIRTPDLSQAAERHQTLQPKQQLSARGRQALQRYWASEYALYQRMSSLAARQRASG